MSKPSSRRPASVPDRGDAKGSSNRFPTNEELLYELRKHGAKPPPCREELRAISRRTRDYLLIAGSGSAIVLFATFKILADSELPVILRLAGTCVAVFCGLLWFIFYGVMSRY